MRRQPSLRSQLNQIRMWVRQGRTDAWIAHKLDVGVDDLARFKREHDLAGDGDQSRARPADPLSVPPPEPRAEEPDEDEDEDEVEDQPDDARPRRERPPRRRTRRGRSSRPAPPADEDEGPDETDDPRPARVGAGSGEPDDDEPDGAPRRRRRRGRRGGRRHRGRRTAYEATFDHGGEGYGLWLDPAVAENPVYSEHWAGHRAVTVTVDPEAITIRRAEPPPGEPAAGDGDDD